MIRKTNDKSLKEAIKEMVDTYHLRKQYDLSSLAHLWANWVGQPIANRTQDIFVRNKILFLKVESAVVKNEIQLMRQNLVARINEHFGSEIILDIRFL